MPLAISDHPIILFDGICNYCIGWVNFIIKHDKKKKFMFCSLQSETAKNLLSKNNFLSAQQQMETVVLIQNANYFFKTDVTIMIAKNFGGWWWSVAILLTIIPPFIRNFFYDIIAHNRYKWFGKKESCMIPTPDIKSRFLE